MDLGREREREVVTGLVWGRNSPLEEAQPGTCQGGFASCTAKPLGAKYTGGKEQPAKDCGCACAHGGGSQDAATDPKPGRERERSHTCRFSHQQPTDPLHCPEVDRLPEVVWNIWQSCYLVGLLGWPNEAGHRFC